MNGDGLPDFTLNKHTRQDGTASKIYTFRAKGPAPDLLKKVKNGIGGSYTYTYSPSSRCADTLLPFVVQTVSALESNDSNGNISTTTFSYSSGLFDYPNREFRGFAKVVQTLPNQNTVESRFHQGLWTKGLMYNQTSKTQDGVMYQKLINTYTTDTATYPNTGFPRLANTEIHLYQDGSELITRASFTYDPSYGNLTGKHQEGDLSATGDERYDGMSITPPIPTIGLWPGPISFTPGRRRGPLTMRETSPGLHSSIMGRGLIFCGKSISGSKTNQSDKTIHTSPSIMTTMAI